MARNVALVWIAGLAACVSDVDGERVGGVRDADGADDDTGGGDTHADDTVDDTVDDTAEDTGGDSAGDTGDTGDDDTGDGWGACRPEAPWTFATPEDVWAAADVVTPDIDGIAAAIGVAEFRKDGGCPTVTDLESEVSMGFSIAGDCTTGAGTRYAGAMTTTVSTVGRSTRTEWRFDGFEIEVADAADPFRFWADGTLIIDHRTADTLSGDPGGLVVEAALVQGLERLPASAYTGRVGEWARALRVERVGVSGQRMDDGYVRVLAAPEGGPTGDLCADFDVQDLGAACRTEGAGALRFIGATEATIAVDGARGCDGCGLVTVDGVEHGVSCPSAP